MKIFVLLIIVIVCGKKVSCNVNDWVIFVKNSISHLNIYQVILFLEDYNSLEAKDLNTLLQYVACETPIVTVSHDIVINKNDNYVSKIKPILNENILVLYVVFNYNESSIYIINNILNFIINISPIQPRPKLLILNNKISSIIASSKNLSIYAWNLKFLDFSIMAVNDKGDFDVYSYNPFAKTFNNHSTTLFPNKLNNMNNYVLKLPTFNLFSVTIQRNHEIKTYDIDQSDEVLKIISRKLDFRIKFVFNTSTISDTNILFNAIFCKLEQDELHMTPVTLPVGLRMYGRKFLIGRLIHDSNHVLMAPIYLLRK